MLNMDSLPTLAPRSTSKAPNPAQDASSISATPSATLIVQPKRPKKPSALIHKMKNGSTKRGPHGSGICFWNATTNLHGNRDAFKHPDTTKIHGLAEAYARYGPTNTKPPFCFTWQNFFDAYVGGVKPVQLCLDPSSRTPYVNAFAFLYKYSDDYGFYGVHLERGTYIIATKIVGSWSKYVIWLGYQEARKRYGEEKIREREELGDWDDDEELGDLIWDKGAGFEGLMPVLSADQEWSSRIKRAIGLVEEEPQAQMDALIVTLKDYEYPTLRTYGPPRLLDLTQITTVPPFRKSRLATGDASLSSAQEHPDVSLADIEHPNHLVAEAMAAPYYGVNLTKDSGLFLVQNGLAHPLLRRATRPAAGSLVNIVEDERKRKAQEVGVDENEEVIRYSKRTRNRPVD